MAENKRSTVLIIDDNEGVRDLLEVILDKRYKILKADCGAAGLALLKAHEVQIVLLDLRLPDMDGLSVLDEIKKQNSLVEVIMISAVNEGEVVTRARHLGAHDYISKTFEYDQVNTLVGKCLEARREQFPNN